MKTGKSVTMEIESWVLVEAKLKAKGIDVSEYFEELVKSDAVPE